jgi:hypothetical protein
VPHRPVSQREAHARGGTEFWILWGARFGYYAGWKGGHESRRNPGVSNRGSGIRTRGPAAKGTDDGGARGLSSPIRERIWRIRAHPGAVAAVNPYEGRVQRGWHLCREFSIIIAAPRRTRADCRGSQVGVGSAPKEFTRPGWFSISH